MELSDKEKRILESLVENQQSEDADNKFRWTPEIQQQILGMICCDRYFAIQCMDLIKPSYFEERPHEMIADIVFQYFRKYVTLPTKYFILQEIEDKSKNLAGKAFYLAEVDVVIRTYEPALDHREYLLDKLTYFAKKQALKSAFSHSFKLILRGGNDQDSIWGEVDVLIRDALKVDRNVDIGLDFFQTMEQRYERMLQAEEQKEIFTTGFNQIDVALLGGGLKRGQIGAWMGLPGTGKSICLVKGAVQNVNNGKKVLYISLEMAEDEVALRFDSQFSSVALKNLLLEREQVWANNSEKVEEYDDKKRLIVKSFPAGSADNGTIRAYVSQLALHGFKPDILFLDYIGELKDISGMNLWESRERLVRDLRGFGQENDHCTITAIQPNRAARAAQQENVVDDEHIGDSSGQLRPLDALWSINQTQQERQACVGRIFVIKHRSGKSRFSFNINFDYDHLVVSELEQDKYKERLAEAGERISELMENELEARKMISDKRFKPGG